MAYEASEIMTATALQYTTSQLNKIKEYTQLQGLIKAGIFVPGGVQFGDTTIQKGFLKLNFHSAIINYLLNIWVMLMKSSL